MRFLRFSVISLLVLVACQKNPETEPSAAPSAEPSEQPSEEPSEAPSEGPQWGEVTDPMGMTDCLGDLWMKEYADDLFTGTDQIHYAKLFFEGAYSLDPLDAKTMGDTRMEFWREKEMRYVCRSEGYALTLPTDGLELDYTLGQYGMAFLWPGAKLRTTIERVRPYSTDLSGYTLYTTEWLTRYLSYHLHISANSLAYSHEKVDKSLELIPGHEVTIWSIEVKKAERIPRHFYNIAIVRPDAQYAKFGLLVYKSETDDYELFLDIIRSFRTFKGRGVTRHYYPRQEPSDDPHWDEATRKYYHKLLEQNSLDFGVYARNLPYVEESNYDSQLARFVAEKERLEGPQGLNRPMEILSNYQHISWYGSYNYFPLKNALIYAGGDGFNGKPVLQYTYQFTNDNNSISPSNKQSVKTPLWDILRGVYDDHFRRLARDVKAYGAPLIFRLNNEMNSDWTSYCGMLTLVDPDIFRETWIYLYNIFIEEGVTNAIWEFNPVAVSCPHSNWGEDLAYYPGGDYVHLLGLTSYEMNNGSGPTPFRTMYTSLYNKNEAVFGDMPAIIGEFACGAGGETTGELKRNAASQAQWVRDMFADFAHRDLNPYLGNIKAAVWFSANDYSGDQIVNQLSLDSDLTETLTALREGLASLE